LLYIKNQIDGQTEIMHRHTKRNKAKTDEGAFLALLSSLTAGFDDLG